MLIVKCVLLIKPPKIGNLPDLFSTPLKVKVVNKQVTAYLYSNGVIIIGGIKYIG